MADKTYTITEQTMHAIYNVLQNYANLDTYHGERTGGILQGCPRAPDPTPDELTIAPRQVLAMLEKEIRPCLKPCPTDRYSLLTEAIENIEQVKYRTIKEPQPLIDKGINRGLNIAMVRLAKMRDDN